MHYLKWLTHLFTPCTQACVERGEVRQAQALITAIDDGGIPLNPVKVNAIARQLGLEVSTKAPMDETVRRIRHAIARI